MTEETCKCGAPWPCFCGASKPYVQKDVTPTDFERVVTPMDYLRSEAERLPGGTAAKVLAMTTTDRCDCGEDTIIGCGSRPDRCCGLNADEDTVTITISRKDAEIVADSLEISSLGWDSHDDARVAAIFRAALEER